MGEEKEKLDQIQVYAKGKVSLNILNILSTIMHACYFQSRLQNCPYFCVFKHARAVKQKVWNEAENRERDWGETLKIVVFFLSPHTCETRALRATLYRFLY